MRVTTPTRAQINAADTTLDAVTRQVWATLIKQSEYYVVNARYFPDLDLKLSNVTSLQAQQLNATLSLIEALGTLDAESNEDGTKFSVAEQRATYVSYGISVLWDVPPDALGFNRRRYSNSARSEATM